MVSQISHKSSDFPAQFQQEALELISGLLPITSSVFCLVDPDMKSKGVVLKDIKQETDQAYRIHYKELDPAHPSRLQDKDIHLQCLSRSMSTTELHNSDFYKEFLQPSNIEDAVDLFFRHEGMIVAVLTILRDVSLPKFKDCELNTLRAVQRFLEYTINSVYIPKRISQRKLLREKYNLTDRQLDVLEWIIVGAENKVIADELSVGLATVKTHLHHIYEKLAVSSRTKLLSKVFAEIGH